MPMSLRWGGCADTDLSFSEFFNNDHTVAIHFMPQFPHAYRGPILTSTDLNDSFIVGQGDYNSGPNAVGVCPIPGHPGHKYADSGDYYIIVDSPNAPGQQGWRRCRKCAILFFGGNVGSKCPADMMAHDSSSSGDYTLIQNDQNAPGQDNWRWCKKCQGLFFGGNPTQACPAGGGGHDGSESGNYTLSDSSTTFSTPGVVRRDDGWRWCKQCQGLWKIGYKLSVEIAAVKETFYPVTQSDLVWQHLALVRSGSLYTLYVNGDRLDPPLTIASVSLSGKLRLGRINSLQHGPKANVQFYGLLDDLAVFNHALSPEEVKTLAKNPNHLSGFEKYLIAGWNFQTGSTQHSKLSRPLVLSEAAKALPASTKRDSVTDAKLLPMPTPKVPMRLPFLPGQPWRVAQGMDNPFSTHHGDASFSFDMARGDMVETKGLPVTSFAAGVVLCVLQNGASGNANEGNMVIVHHAEDELSGYLHLLQNSAKVKVADYVDEGQPLAGTGDTGTNLGAFHLHCSLINTRTPGEATTIPLAFRNYELSKDGGKTWNFVSVGVPQEGDWVRNPTVTSGQAGWRWCKKCQGLFFAGINTQSKCPVDNMSHDGGGSRNYILVVDNPDVPSQKNWRWCNKCQGLFFAGNNTQSKCPAGAGGHDGSSSGNYTLVVNSVGGNQHGWRWCNKCQGLFFNSDSPSKCPADSNAHNSQGSGDYSLIAEPLGVAGQTNWRWCRKCQGLFFNGNLTKGKCQAGTGGHDGSSSIDYGLALNPANAPAQSDWKWCKKCEGLFDGGSSAASKCPATGTHDGSSSSDYKLFFDASSVRGHRGWRWCKNCQGLFFRGFTTSKCPAGPGTEPHDGVNGFPYKLLFSNHGLPPENFHLQHDWRWCKKCQGLYFDDPTKSNSCPATGTHDGSDSIAYALVDSDTPTGQNGWRYCKKCQGLFFGGNPAQGKCPAGGPHDGSSSGRYSLINNVANAPGHSTWKWCKKCQGLFFAAVTNGLCPDAVGGTAHDDTGSGNYTLLPSTTN